MHVVQVLISRRFLNWSQELTMSMIRPTYFPITVNIFLIGYWLVVFQLLCFDWFDLAMFSMSTIISVTPGMQTILKFRQQYGVVSREAMMSLLIFSLKNNSTESSRQLQVYLLNVVLTKLSVSEQEEVISHVRDLSWCWEYELYHERPLLVDVARQVFMIIQTRNNHQ